MSLTLHTTHGPLKCELFLSSCPKTTTNFLALAASGSYDGTTFHRNLPGFMVQGGDVEKKNGKGGWSIYGKHFADEIRSSLKFNSRGILAMATSGPNTSSSQFFITYVPLLHLDGQYTIFGKVIDGAEDGGTLDILEKMPVDAKGKPTSQAGVVKIEKVTIHANPIAMEARDGK